MNANQFATNQIVKKETLYTGEHDLGNGMYQIEILKSQTDDLVISAQHIQLPDSFIIEIEQQKVGHLISEFNNDFLLMANFLKIMNKRMVLLNPVSTQAKKFLSYSFSSIFFRNLLPNSKSRMRRKELTAHKGSKRVMKINNK